MCMCTVPSVVYLVSSPGSEKQMRDTLQDYLKGDWDSPWDRCESDAEDGSRNFKRKLGTCIWLVMSTIIGLLCHLSLELCNYACLYYCYIDGAEEGGCKKKAKTKATPPGKHLVC